MAFAAELIVIVGALAIIVALLVKRIPQAKAAAFLGGSLVVAGTVFGGLAWAGIPAFIELPGEEIPTAQSLFVVNILGTSDTDRTEVGETISPDGHSITWVMNDNDMDGLGDINLDVRATNANSGTSDDIWAFAAEITFVTYTTSNTQPLLNQTDFNSRWAVSWTLTEAGSPTLAQVGDKAESRDWKTGMSDVLNCDLEINSDATADLGVTIPGQIQAKVGGVTLIIYLVES